MDDEARMRTAIDADDWSKGPADAPVTLLEYGDLECPHCAEARPEIRAALARYEGQVRYVWRHFPISSTHPHAMAAAVAAEASGAQGSFWEMVDMLLTHQHALEDDDLLRYAQLLELDVDRFEQDMRSSALQQAVRDDFRRGIEDGVNGTPTLFVNDLRFDDAVEREGLAEAISAALMG